MNFQKEVILVRKTYYFVMDYAFGEQKRMKQFGRVIKALIKLKKNKEVFLDIESIFLFMGKAGILEVAKVI